MRKLAFFVAGLMVAAALPALAQPRPPVPAVVLDHINDLDGRCSAAGGRPGTGRHVFAQDFTGDGRLDYLVSEGDYDCSGRPGLFRSDGVARVDIYVTDERNAARRVYSDRLIAYRLLAGKPVTVQIARRGAACGPGSTPTTQCAAQLAWNGAGFGEALSVSDASTAAAQPPAPAAPTAAAAPGPATALAVQPDAQARFLAQCRAAYVARSADAARWADEQCASDWGKVVASGPATDALLAALPAAPGEAVPVAALRKRLAAVRWAGKPAHKQVTASGALGDLAVSVTGAPNATGVGVSWMQVGAEPPYDVVGAMRARGVTVTEVGCEDLGAGEWQRVYAAEAPGRAPFALEVGQRTAPTANANSYYSATVSLAGKAPGGPTQRCDNPANF